MNLHSLKLFSTTVLLFLCISFVQAENLNKPIIAVAPDKELCEGSEGFIPIPKKSKKITFKYLMAVIDKKLGKKCKLNGIYLGGRIEEGELEHIKLAYNLLNKRRNPRTIGANTIWLNSPGGLIHEAMKIGDFIAEKRMKAIITFNGKCFSSCVFIYAAAKTRSGIGDVGIHRPFANEISAESLSYSKYLSQYNKFTPILKDYFAKYGVSPSIVDVMNITPSDNIKILTREERKGFGLGFQNIAAKEHNKARTIQICGKNYYDLHLKFHGLINSCRKRFGITALDEKNNECWELARQTFPEYLNKFDQCKAKKSKGIGR